MPTSPHPYQARLRGVKQQLLLSLLIIAIVSACSSRAIERGTTPASSEASQASCRIVQHAMGETCIPLNPQRVVTLWKGTFCSTLALGIKPIGYTRSLDKSFPEYLQSKADGVESVGTYEQPSLEKILLLKPDLILSIKRFQFQDIYTQLSKIAPTVVIDVSAPPPPWQKHLEDVAKIFDKEQEKKQLIDEYWQRIEQLKQALGDRRHQIQVSIATSYPEIGGVYTYGKKFSTSVVLDDIGLKRPPAQRGDFWVMPNISYERLSEIDGDILFLCTRKNNAYEQALEKLQQSPLWQKLKVVQQNQVYIVDLDYWSAFDVLAMNAVIDDLFKYLVNTS
ncbi:iron-siderophore ABC transporter substrate-binding protein [Nostoc sp. LPT]|uniref:iron-siderophore ABC transporter substrate-binding protein n=1 Tax=Nostoc sp. LPT TaxID=2815387 RepID=UPI001DCF4A06|nr:iron-siderophore ABC transporter substrate-binding protein [Nostoc sp. LPT]MBN4003639.1 iron-siderophore ABC transporter substrate-binding protein [Nostoc sp. LPT]